MKTKNNVYDKELCMLLEYNYWENYKQLSFSNKITGKLTQFLICDKNWIIKWKDLLGYDKIKDKLIKINEEKNDKLKKKLKEEIKQYLINRENENKKYDIGKMNNVKLLKKNKKGNVIDYFEEERNFEVIDELRARSLTKVMDKEIKAIGKFLKGVLLIYNLTFDKDSNKKIVAFFENKDNQIQKEIFTVGKNEDIKEKMNVISEIVFKKMIEKKEKEGKNDNIIEGMNFKLIKNDLKIENIKEEVKFIDEIKEKKKDNEEEIKNTKEGKNTQKNEKNNEIDKLVDIKKEIKKIEKEEEKLNEKEKLENNLNNNNKNCKESLLQNKNYD